MFIRRHHLLRPNVLKPTSLRRTNNNIGLATPFSTQHSFHVRCASRPASDQLSRAETGLASSRQLYVGLRHITTEANVHPTDASYTSLRTAATPSEVATGMYFMSNNPDPTSLIHMPAEDVKQELTLLADKRDVKRLKAAAQDIIKYYHGSYPFHHVTVVHHILSLSKSRILFDLATLHALLVDLRDRGVLSKTPPFLLATVAHTTISKATTSRDLTHEIPIYSMIYPILISSLSTRSMPRNPEARFSTMRVQWVLFKIIARLVQEEQFDAIMPMINSLVHSGTIPESSMQNLPSSGFAQIVFTILLRCCLDWGWRSRAQYLLLRIPEWNKAKSPAFNNIVREVVHFVLGSEEEPSHPQLAAALMVRIINNADVFTVSDQSVQRFYDLMMKYDLSQEAQAFYELTRSDAILPNHRYPPPQGQAYTWMLNMAVKGQVVRVTRALVVEAIEGHVDVPPLSRPPLITEAAAHGFMTHARTLWTRWERDVFVIGDAGVTLRLVSLVVNRIASVQYKAERIALENADRARALEVDDSPEYYADLGLPEDVTSSPGEGEGDPSTDSDAGDAAEDTGNSMSFEEQVAEYRAFAEHVVETFRRCHEPLDRAHHRILNALARLYIMTGNVTEGFKMLKIIRDRKQSPDIRDVNVALTALMNHNPRAAARMLVRMIEMGLQPDTVSFGTVIHQAALHGDMPLATSLILRARQIGIAQLDYKTIGSLIRAAISTPFNESAKGSPHRTQLRNVRALVDSLVEANYIPSPQMGVDCVHAALRADDPVEAHRFWQQLVKNQVEFADYKQRAMRLRIARLIGRHLYADMLSAGKANRMLTELGYDAKAVAKQQQRAQEEDAEAAGKTEAKDEHP